ncbi:uracil DNA glycosylase [Dispira simplex]|nr:uracil DNA glycosylase [Dispira simplex]
MAAQREPASGIKRPRTLQDFFKPTKLPSPQDRKGPTRKKIRENDSSSNGVLTPPDNSSTEASQQVVLARPLPKLESLDESLQPLLKLEYDTLDPSWLRVLCKELTKSYFVELKRFLATEKAQGKSIFPPESDIYSWSRYTPVDQVRVVILGQDPYHNNNQAHGLCFSVRKGIRTPPSLVNMYTALQNDYPDFEKPSHGYLASWASQGVLMLNASLTVRAHEANSHSGRGWEKFTDAVVGYINEHKSHVVFMLWGSYAQKKGSGIDKKKHLVLKSVHPSPLSAHRGFFTCHHFKQANEYLVAHSRTPIDWHSVSQD